MLIETKQPPPENREALDPNWKGTGQKTETNHGLHHSSVDSVPPVLSANTGF